MTVSASNQGEVRIVITNLRRTGVDLGAGEVGRVRGDHVDLATQLPGKRLEQVPGEDVAGGAGRQTRGGPKTCEVATRECDRGRVEVSGSDVRTGDFVSDRERDRATARTRLDDDRATGARDRGVGEADGRSCEYLGFRTGDEHAGFAGEDQASKARLAGEMLEGDAKGAAGDEVAEPVETLGGNPARSGCSERHRRQTENMTSEAEDVCFGGGNALSGEGTGVAADDVEEAEGSHGRRGR